MEGNVREGWSDNLILVLCVESPLRWRKLTERSINQSLMAQELWKMVYIYGGVSWGVTANVDCWRIFRSSSRQACAFVWEGIKCWLNQVQLWKSLSLNVGKRKKEGWTNILWLRRGIKMYTAGNYKIMHIRATVWMRKALFIMLSSRLTRKIHDIKKRYFFTTNTETLPIFSSVVFYYEV